jgi:hypothetical protein
VTRVTPFGPQQHYSQSCRTACRDRPPHASGSMRCGLT